MTEAPGILRPPAALSALADAARAYVAFIDALGPRTRAPDARLERVLARLHAGALDLAATGVEVEVEAAGPVEAANDEVARAARHAEICAKSAYLGFDLYRVVVNPHGFDDFEAVGVGSLGDDLADIYLDVVEGLGAYEAGAFGRAEQAWRDSFEAHWGEHAAQALAALHAFTHP